jgi:phage I-like protein
LNQDSVKPKPPVMARSGLSKLLDMVRDTRSKLDELEMEINNQAPSSKNDAKKRRKRHN